MLRHVTTHLAAGVGGIYSGLHVIFNAHSMLGFFDDLANARLVSAPLGFDNALSILLLLAVVIHAGRTGLEVKDRRRAAAEQAKSVS